MENEELMEKVKMKRLYILWQELGINILIFYGNNCVDLWNNYHNICINILIFYVRIKMAVLVRFVLELVSIYGNNWA